MLILVAAPSRSPDCRRRLPRLSWQVPRTSRSSSSKVEASEASTSIRDPDTAEQEQRIREEVCAVRGTSSRGLPEQGCDLPVGLLVATSSPGRRARRRITPGAGPTHGVQTGCHQPTGWPVPAEPAVLGRAEVDLGPRGCSSGSWASGARRARGRVPTDRGSRARGAAASHKAPPWTGHGTPGRSRLRAGRAAPLRTWSGRPLARGEHRWTDAGVPWRANIRAWSCRRDASSPVPALGCGVRTWPRIRHRPAPGDQRMVVQFLESGRRFGHAAFEDLVGGIADTDCRTPSAHSARWASSDSQAASSAISGSVGPGGIAAKEGGR